MALPDLSWMAWTWPTAIFFIIIALLLLLMTLWTLRFPAPPRKGMLGISTTAGDRLFIALLGSAFLCLLWLALWGSPLWGALGICLLYSLLIFRWA